MADYSNLPLVLLYTRSRESVDGKTRFQKLIFLAQKETEIPEIYEFEPDNFGPYSPGLESDLHSLDRMGLIEISMATNGVGNERYEYHLTTSGIKRVQQLLKQQRLKPVFESLDEVKGQYNSKSLSDLLHYVYRRYEEYTTETELDLDQLFDHSTDSQFRESDSEDEYVGPGPGEWKTKNPSAEEFFSVN